MSFLVGTVYESSNCKKRKLEKCVEIKGGNQNTLFGEINKKLSKRNFAA